MSHRVTPELRIVDLTDDQRCLHESTCEYNFVRTFTCSLPKGHGGGHVAYWNNDPDYEDVTAHQPAWTGPWK